MITLTPGSTQRTGDVEEWKTRLEAYVGLRHPHLKKAFSDVHVADDGQKRHSRLTEAPIVCDVDFAKRLLKMGMFI